MMIRSAMILALLPFACNITVADAIKAGDLRAAKKAEAEKAATDKAPSVAHLGFSQAQPTYQMASGPMVSENVGRNLDLDTPVFGTLNYDNPLSKGANDPAPGVETSSEAETILDYAAPKIPPKVCPEDQQQRATGLHADDGASELPPDVRVLLRCHDLCDHGSPSAEDIRSAERMLAADGAAADKEQLAMQGRKICLYRCRAGKKSMDEETSVPSVEEYQQLPEPLLGYRRAAALCAKAGLRPMSELLTGLEQCGVVHFKREPAPLDLLADVRSAYEALQADSTERTLRVDTGRLRAGREELWLPFRWPFNALELLLPKDLLPVIKAYLGPNATLDHVTILTAPASTAFEAQQLHADVNEVRRHVEVHLPLTNIPLAMGPTLFCPASQGIWQQSFSLMKAYFGIANCRHDSSLSYVLPLNVGEVTIYDSNIFHAGTANLAGTDRPVLQLSFAADGIATQARNYAGNRTFLDNASRWQIMADVEAFRNAAIFN